MEYQIEYMNGKPRAIRFVPSLVNSDGVYYPKLASIALTRIGISGWSWRKDDNLIRYINGQYDQQYIEHTIEVAQRQVTALIDRLLRWDTYKQILEEYRK